MLHVADRIDSHDADLFPTPPSQSNLPPLRPDSATAQPSSRYGDRKSPSWIIIGFVLVFHALLIAALLHARHQMQRREEARLSVVNLTPPAPPPMEEAPTPPPSKPQVAAPAPLVQVPTLAIPQIATAPIPPPPVSSGPAVIAPVAPVSIAAPAPPSVMQGGDLSSQMVSGKPPRYPIESRRKREQGTVVLTLMLGLDGAVETIAIARSSGFSRLDDAARDAVRRWRWRPMIQQGQPVKVKGIVEIPFILQINAA